jgi:type I restriction enzyme S subunit
MSHVPSGWAEPPVTQLLEVTIGGVWGNAKGSDEVEVRVVRVADFRDDGSISFDSAPVRSITARQLASRELRDGDLLLEKSGGGTTKPVGRVVRMRSSSERVIPTNFVQLLRPDQRVVDPAYLFWWLWYSHINGTVASFQRATTNIRNLRTSDYLRRSVPLPPLNEQRRIVAAIEEHLSRLDAAEASLVLASRRVSALSRSSLHRFIETLDEPRRPLIAAAEFVTDGDHNPPKRVPAGIPHLTAKNVKNGQLVFAGASFVSDEGFAQTRERYEPREGDVIVTCVGTIGQTAVVPPDLVFSADRNLAAIRPLDHVDPRYLHFALNTPRVQEWMARASSSTAQPHLYLRDLRSLEIPMPSPDDQRRIVAQVEERLSAIDALRESVARAKRRSASLRRAILERAFRGELVPQDPADEPASALLQRIRAESETRGTRRPHRGATMSEGYSHDG